MAAPMNREQSADGTSAGESQVRGLNPKTPREYPREVRLRGKALAGKIFKEGRYHGLGLLQAKSLPRDGGGSSRFLISIRKSVGSAPVRNRIRRVVREAIRLNRERLVGAHDICLFITRRPKLPIQLAAVEPEILRLFARLSAAQK